MTRTPLSKSKGQRSRTPGRFKLTRQAAAAVSVGTIGRGNLLLRCGLHYAGVVGSAARGASAPTEGIEGRGILWRPPAYSLFVMLYVSL